MILRFPSDRNASPSVPNPFEAPFLRRAAAARLPLLFWGLILAGCNPSMTNDPPLADPDTPPRPERMEIVAHRGASDVAPENTVAAYRLAWQMNADAAETDIYLTPDNRVVALHDKTTKRTTGVDLPAASTPFSDLRKLDAGSWKDPKYAGEPIPLLEDILATVPSGKTLYIEVKCGPEVLPYLSQILDRSGKRAQTKIIGFDLPTMAEAKKVMPDRPVFWLCSTRKDKDTGVSLSHDLGWIDLAKAHRLDGLDVNYAGVTPHFANAVRAAGLGFLVWTVDEPADAVRMRQLGAEGLTTDKPDLMKGLFGS